MTTICCLKDDMPAAYTFTSDDALYKSCKFFNSEFKRLGLRGSFAMVTDNILKDADTISDDKATRSDWARIFKDGAFDITNHSKSHPYFSGLTKEQCQAEINGAQDILQSHFPQFDVITMANPYVVNSDIADSVIRENHYAGRNGSTGYNSLDPNETEWFRLKTQFAATSSNASITMNEWIDTAISEGKWLIELWHGVDGQGYGPPSSTEATKHFEYVASKKGSIWCASFNDVTKYIRERQNARLISVENTPTGVTLELSHSLDKKIFNLPLTLKTLIPSGRMAASVMQNGIELPSVIKTEGGHRYAMYDALPNLGPITLKY